MTDNEILRYSRQIKLPEIGIEGQERISRGRVLVVGAGGLGSPAALYLAASGVGTLGLCDGDAVEVSNLARQILHGTDAVGRPKVDSARDTLTRLNPHVKVETHPEFLTDDNAGSIISAYDFVLLCTDSLESKYAIAAQCERLSTPYSYGGAQRFEGQTFTYLPGKASLRDLYGDLPPAECRVSCARTGVMGTVCGVIGCIQATEALKYLAGTGTLLTNALLSFNALTMDFQKVSL